IKRIKAETLDGLLKGDYDEEVSETKIIDCRSAYEFTGGHIKSAINAESEEVIDDLFFSIQSGVPVHDRLNKGKEKATSKKLVLVFYCEFSSVRGPTMALYLREKDRETNHPFVYPEVYVLDGGFKNYVTSSEGNCE
ncbi:Rhodanese-like domain-containing protein, partial [Melampsora americana]